MSNDFISQVFKGQQHGDFLDFVTGIMLLAEDENMIDRSDCHFRDYEIFLVCKLKRRLTIKDINKYFRPGISKRKFVEKEGPVPTEKKF
jgi:hypothetical protein